MSEKPAKQSPVIELVAVDRGFMNGVAVEPGTAFMFDRTPLPGTPANKLDNGLRRLPKWALTREEAKQALAAKAAKAKAFDTRPVAAKQAAQQKSAAFGGGSPL